MKLIRKVVSLFNIPTVECSIYDGKNKAFIAKEMHRLTQYMIRTVGFDEIEKDTFKNFDINLELLKGKCSESGYKPCALYIFRPSFESVHVRLSIEKYIPKDCPNTYFFNIGVSIDDYDMEISCSPIIGPLEKIKNEIREESFYNELASIIYRYLGNLYDRLC